MVKKHKGGRRQILQLEDKKPRNEWEPTSTASLNKEASPLDSQVADFFKEIDALTVNEHIEESNSEAACVSSEIASCSKQKDSEDSKPEDNLPEKSEGNHAEGSKNEVGSYCPWQEICDESTGYNYYWNVETNDVTWDCPSEYILYLKSLQSADNEYFSVSNDSNSNETYKKTKRKKDVPLPPEGAIIPISYFGDSSSEDSSEDEKENGLATALMNAKQKAKSKVNILNKQNCSKKNDSHSSDNKKDSCIETMGPHLPNENHFSKKNSAHRTSISSKEAEINSKNEVDEYLEIGPQLASNSGVDLSKSADCNTVSDSSSKCTSVAHLVKNGPSVASSTYEEPWEVSLMNIERKFRGLDQDIGEESPDSTVRKGDASSENSVPCQTSNDTFGIRGVVEYDNFTDEEEEMGSSNISSSKQESVTSQRAMSSAYRKSRDCDNSVQRQFDSSKSEVSQSEAQRTLPKRKFFGKTDEYENAKFKKTKDKQKDKLDIDSLFNNHGNSGKYGFGFSRQEQLNLESDFYCSTSGQNQSSTSKGSSDYKSISFVKSDHVFNLSTVNKDSSDNPSHSRTHEHLVDQCDENIYAPGPSGLNGLKESSDSKELNSHESNFLQNDSVPNENHITNSAKPSSVNRHSISKACSVNRLLISKTSEKKDPSSGQKDVSSSRTIHNDNLYKMEEDIDEIDRVLSEALEAKKAENAASRPSSSSPSVSPNSKKRENNSSITKKTSIESAKSVGNSGNLSEDIITLSSILIDKLTFLISNHTTLSSLSSLLIQLQTRLIDWQSGSLESKYFMSRLQEVQQYLHHYEVGAVSGDWSCEWDRENKRYFYRNSRTHQSQWSYPEELCGRETSWMPSSTNMASTSSASSEIAVERDELQTVSSSVPEGQLHNKSSFTKESSKKNSEKYSDPSMWISESSPPPPPPGVDSPPPPPPQSPPPDSPPPPPPDSTEVEDLLEDMDIENSDDSNPPLIVTNSRHDTPADTLIQYQKFAIPSPERLSENFPSASLSNAVSSTSLSSFEDMNTVTKSPQLVSTSRDTFDTADSLNMHWSMSQPSCSTDVASNFDSESEVYVLQDPKLRCSDKDTENATSSSRHYICSNEVSTYRKPCGPYTSTSMSAPSTSSTSGPSISSNSAPSTSTNSAPSTSSTSAPSTSSTAAPSTSSTSAPSTSSTSAPSTSRKERKKAKLSSGLALKKKNIPSLVEKWQKIKEEQEREDKDSEDPRN